MIDFVLMVNALLLAQEINILVGIIDLNSANGIYITQIGLYPFPLITGGGTPVCFNIFIHRIIGMVTAEGGGYCNRFVVVEQHPAGEGATSLPPTPSGGGGVGGPSH